MDEISEVLGVNGSGYPIAGMTMHRPTYRDKSEYVAWLVGNARKEVREWKEVLDEADFVKQVAGRGLAISAFAYSWGSELCEVSLKSREGRVHLMYIVSKRKNPDSLEEEIGQSYEDMTGEFDAAFEWMTASPPNSRSPVVRATAAG